MFIYPKKFKVENKENVGSGCPISRAKDVKNARLKKEIKI